MNKQEDFHTMFETVSFDRVMREYMMSTKLLLAKADDADLETLRTALVINKKMGKRLEAIVKLREEEESNGDVPLADLLNSLLDQ